MNSTSYKLAFSLFLNFTSAQIDGFIFDLEANEPIQNVNISAGDLGTTSGSLGEFTLDVPLGTIIEFSHIGYETVKIKGRSGMSVNMQKKIIQSDEIIVNAGLIRERLRDKASSIFVATDEDIRDDATVNLQDLVDKIPNLNWAGGTSRPRYFQIRGIGERSHYFGEGPPNFSVGFLLDNIDISGMGMVGQLFDINQVEVFKGPQSSVYGPNAIAGLITLFSKDPTNELDLKSSLTIGTDNQLGFATVLGNGITPRISYRLSGVFETSDGFRKNISRDIRNSNEIEEAMLRVKLKMVPTKNVSILSTLLFSQINNGYDVWSPDNNISLKTYTDDPGKDSQDTYGLSINGDIVLNKHFKLKNIISMTNTKAYHSYDADWGDSTYWMSVLGDGYFPIRDYYQESKNRLSYSIESRIYSNQVVLGIYKREFQEKQDAIGYIYAGDGTDGSSDFKFNSIAGYLQHYIQPSEKFSFKSNIRYEIIDYLYDGETYYGDSLLTPVSHEVQDDLVGYRASLLYKASNNINFFFSSSRGYKSGGINQHPKLEDASRPFGSEYADNFEMGFKYIGHRLRSNFTLFQTTRSNQQISISDQVVKDDPNAFLFYTSNAGSGWTKGIESENIYTFSKNIKLSTNFGFLDTYVDNFKYQTKDWSGNIIEESGGGRSAAMAPSIMASFGLTIDIFNLLVNADISYKDEYYFSDSHNEKSSAYTLIDLNLTKKLENFSFKFLVNNIFDKRYPVRGFYFGLIPPDYPDQLWVSHGNPRQIAITVNYNL